MAGENKDDKGAAVETVTTEDLMKSIRGVTGKPETAAAAPVKKVVVTALAKSFPQHVQEKASVATQKAIEVSDVLQEIVGLVGSHVDGTLETLAKSITGTNETQLAIVEGLVALKKSTDENTEILKKLLAEPGRPASAAGITVDKSVVLQKSVTKDGAVDPNLARKNVLAGLESLAKSVKPGSPEQSNFQSALIRYESTGQISDQMLAAAANAFKAPPAPATL